MNFERLTLLTLVLLGNDMASTLQTANSEIALRVVAFNRPAFLWVEIDAELAIKTADAEVHSMVVVDASGHLCRHEKIFVGHGILSYSHDSHKLFKSANAELEEVKLVLEDG